MNTSITTGGEGILIYKKNPSKPAAAPAAIPIPSTASVRPAALEVVVVGALVEDPLDEGDVTVGEIVPMDVGMDVGTPVGVVVSVMPRDDNKLCTDADSEERKEEYELVSYVPES